MTPRQLFHDIMSYRGIDRIPVIHWDGWKETLLRWQSEGMPSGMDQHQYFNSVPFWQYLSESVYPEHVYLLPPFDEEVFEETKDYYIKMNSSGVVEKGWKNQSSIPQWIRYSFQTARDWHRYKERLRPDMKRIETFFGQLAQRKMDPSLPHALPIGSMMGWLRDWMGVENMTYLIHDDPNCFQDITDTIANLVCWSLDHIVPRMKTAPDLCFMWEDICGSTGPFVSPAVFKKHISQAQMRIRETMRRHSIPYLCIDSDGNVEALVGPWKDSGMDILFPVEVGTWHQTPEKIRRRYGKELRLVGGFDKMVLERDEKAIDLELESHIALIREGGYLIMPDHVITPGTPLKNYRYYLERIRGLRV